MFKTIPLGYHWGHHGFGALFPDGQSHAQTKFHPRLWMGRSNRECNIQYPT